MQEAAQVADETAVQVKGTGFANPVTTMAVGGQQVTFVQPGQSSDVNYSVVKPDGVTQHPMPLSHHRIPSAPCAEHCHSPNYNPTLQGASDYVQPKGTHPSAASAQPGMVSSTLFNTFCALSAVDVVNLHTAVPMNCVKNQQQSAVLVIVAKSYVYSDSSS